MASQKLGQPVPESNLEFESKSALPQSTQRYSPGACWSYSAPEKANSVAARRVTSYCSGVSCFFHSDLLLRTFGSVYTPSLAPSSANFTILTGLASPSASSPSAKAERQTRSTPTSKPYAPAVAAPKISPRRVISFIAINPERSLFCRTHRRGRQEWQPLGFSACATHFQLLKEQRRRHDRGR